MIKPTPSEEAAKRRVALAEGIGGAALAAIGTAIGLHGFVTSRRWLLLTVSVVVFAYAIGVLMAASHWYDLTEVGRRRTRRAGHVLGVAVVAALLAGGFVLDAGPGDSDVRSRRRHPALRAVLGALVVAPLVALAAGIAGEVITQNDAVVLGAAIAGLFVGAVLGVLVSRAGVPDARGF